MIGQVGVRIPERFRETREIVPPGKPPRDHIKNVKGSLENLKQTGAIFWHIVIEPRRLVAHIAAKTVSSPAFVMILGFVQPANSRDVSRAREASCEEWQICRAGRWREAGWGSAKSARLDDFPADIRQIASLEQFPNDIGAGAVYKIDDDKWSFQISNLL